MNEYHVNNDEQLHKATTRSIRLNFVHDLQNVRGMKNS